MTFTDKQISDLLTLGVTFFDAGQAEVVGKYDGSLDVHVTLTGNTDFKVYVTATCANCGEKTTDAKCANCGAAPGELSCDDCGRFGAFVDIDDTHKCRSHCAHA